MNYSRRPALRPMSQINVVPYIDVMLVLLVIFMVAAPMMNPGRIDLPSVGKALTPPIAPLEVIIHKDSTLAVRDRSEPGEALSISREGLSAYVRKKQAHHPEQPVVISADRNVRYEKVISVMDILQRLHVRKIGLLVKTR